MIKYPQIDPVLISIGSLKIRWYGLAYVMGLILGGWVLYKKCGKAAKMTIDDLSTYLTWIMTGVLLGGRLAYVVIYNAPYYIHHLIEIFYIWQGGMAFHGGAAGAAIATVAYARKYQKDPWLLLDGLGLGATVGIAMGRVANFINAELVGRVSNVPWAMIFPGEGPLPRHPSQLYEAFGEGVFLFVVLWLVSHKFPLKAGQLFALFCIGYGLMRFSLEFFRQPDPQLGFILASWSMGQLLCVVMIVVGMMIWVHRTRS